MLLLSAGLLAACAMPAGGAALTVSPPASPTPSPSPAASPSPAPSLTPAPPASPTPPPPSPTPLTCLAAGGTYDHTSLRSDLLKLPMEVQVYLPPCYAEQPDHYYPVLYLIHGQSYTEDQWDRLGVDETLDRLVPAGELPPFIVVMPRDRLWADPTESNFGQVVLGELLPWIDQTYRTIPDREFRAVGGLSRGAAWAIHLGLSHWELFGAIGAHSSPVFYSDTGKLRPWLQAIPAEQMPRIYLDIGDRDYLSESNTWLKGVLDSENTPHEYYLFPGYHEEDYWSAHVEQYLRWYAQEW